MACTVKYLSSAGIQHREVKGLDALAAAWPINWLVYASLHCFPPRVAPIEIDVIAVMDDRVVLFEVKDWNGNLTFNGDNWVVGRQRRGRSPVKLGNDKAKKIKTMIRDHIPQLGSVYVDSRVILTGTSTRDNLPDEEKPYVLTLQEAALLTSAKERDRLLGKVRLSKFKPNMLKKEFEKLFGNASYFRPLAMTWDGYGVTDEDFYVHRRDVWREHRAHRVREERVKALLRLWRFDNLPAGLNEPDGRQRIAERETRVVAHLGDRRSWMAERGILKEVGTPPDEILTQHHQLVSVPAGWTTLQRYVEKNGAEITAEQRVDIAHTLASMVAELHAHGVAHRDIGGASIWVGAPTSMSLTGFFSARLPDETSVAEFREVLATYAEPEPDWGGDEPTATERDVRSLGLIMEDLAAIDEDESSLPSGWAEVTARAVAAPGERYPDARALAEALGELKTPSGPHVDQSRLDAFETRDVPYAVFPISGAPVSSGITTRYESGTFPARKVVKVWNGVLRGDAKRDYALLGMFETAAALRNLPAPGVARVEAFGLSPSGAFVVTHFVEGSPLQLPSPLPEAELLPVLAELTAVVDGLHAREVSHGDLHPGNVIVGEGGAVTLIDLLDVAPLGEGRLRSPGWAPADFERRSEQQIDRFAVCKMVFALLSERSEPSLQTIAKVAAAELERNSIETLEPLLDAIDIEHRGLFAPAPGSFRIVAPGLSSQVLEGDDGHLWVKSHRSSQEVESYFVTGLNSRLLLRVRNGTVDHVEEIESRFQDLAHGERVRMSLALAAGSPMEGAAELAEFLREAAPAPEWTPRLPVQPDSGEQDEEWIDEDDVSLESIADESDEAFAEVDLCSLQIPRLWMRAAEIEEDAVLTVRLDNRLADVSGASVFRYETPRPLEFEDEDTVEVRLPPGLQGRFLGLLDVPRCDASQLVIRNLRHPIAGGGELVALVDRRDRVSKERRRRAVERVIDGKSVIRDLIDYFDPVVEKVEAIYDLAPDDADLARYRLNEGQRDAFRHLLAAGPLGLLQGPPGSGKTLFIASFVHWLLMVGGARRVLVASQSHEAVNNVLEQLLKTYHRHGGHADLLRVGSRGATDRIRPYQARSLRERYRVRFENGLKTRVAHAAGAAGIPRAFVHDVVGTDLKLGSLHRALDLAAQSAQGDTVYDDRRRSEQRLATLRRAFAAVASAVLGHEVDLEATQPAEVVEEAYAAVLVAHPKVSPGDLVTTRKLLALAHEWKDTLGSGHRNFDEFLAKTRQVVAGTCVGLGQSQIRLEGASFDWVIVDEAARCTSGELAVPLQLGSRIVLVGDQRQLRPMVDRTVQVGLRQEFRGIPREELERSDFERAFASPYGRRNAQVLDEQYRMAPAISDMVSSIFYAPHGVRLKPSDDREPDRSFTTLPADLATPVVWYDTAGRPGSEEEERGRRDFWNEAEIEATLGLLRRLSRESGLVEELAKRNDPPIGVICMYSEQKRRIEREWSHQPFPESFRRLVTIDTVDAYQGKENAVVILSLVRANDEFQPGHVGRENRCNVALSRAKERLYILGNTRMWGARRVKFPMSQVLTYIRNMPEASGVIRPAGEIDQ
jgi:hypothetical protein